MTKDEQLDPDLGAAVLHAFSGQPVKCETWVADVQKLKSHIAALEAKLAASQDAIRRHRDQRSDDRCWEDDLELYRSLPEGVADADLALPPREEFLGRCAAYEAHRRSGTSEKWETVAELKQKLAAQSQGYAERERLVAELVEAATDLSDATARTNGKQREGCGECFGRSLCPQCVEMIWDRTDRLDNALAALARPPGDEA